MDLHSRVDKFFFYVVRLKNTVVFEIDSIYSVLLNSLFYAYTPIKTLYLNCVYVFPRLFNEGES